MTIPLTPVDSSQIAAIGHDPETETLAIQFHTGAVYHYKHFTREDYAAFAAAESIGSYFYRNIKHETQKYPYKRQ